MVKNMLYDVIVIGGGSAGLTAALYTARKKLKTLVLSQVMGGQTATTSIIENYPGVPKADGMSLMQDIQKQTQDSGAEIKFFKVKKVENVGEGNREESTEPNFKVILSNDEEYFCKALILAFGKTPRALGIPGEDKFMGRGVSVCVTCDAPIFQGKIVAVVGGGNSALDGAIELSKFCEKVYIIHRRDEYRGDEATVEKVKNTKNIEQLLSYVPTEVKGEKFVSGLTVENAKDKSKKELKLDGVFVQVGYIVDPSPVKGLVELNKMNEIIIDMSNKTSAEGIFAAGDCTITPYKQTIISAGDGAKAALEAHKFLTGGRLPIADWK
jgi:thioredoxin-disulfide reductase